MSTLKQLTDSYASQIAHAKRKSPANNVDAQVNVTLRQVKKCMPRGNVYQRLSKLQNNA